MSATDRLLAHNERYARDFCHGELGGRPRLKVAVVACMDARLNLYGALGLSEGDAHLITNAGGVITADEIRSLAISQRLLGTEEIVLVHHTDCGMLSIDDEGFKATLERETGVRPEWPVESFTDLEADVRQSMARIKSSPFIPHKHSVRGFVYDVASGRLQEIL